MFSRKTDTYSDEDLMQSIAAGDQTAFALLYTRYKNRMYYYFFRMLNNSEELANDFLQELFLKIIENPGAFNPAYKFSSWIFTLAGNMCKNEYRKRSTRGEQITCEFVGAATEEPSFSAYTAEEAIGKIFEALNCIEPEHRSTFLLRYREGFSIKEIAGIQNIAEGTVKSRIHNAKKMLARELRYLKDEIEF